MFVLLIPRYHIRGTVGALSGKLPFYKKSGSGYRVNFELEDGTGKVGCVAFGDEADFLLARLRNNIVSTIRSRNCSWSLAIARSKYFSEYVRKCPVTSDQTVFFPGF